MSLVGLHLFERLPNQNLRAQPVLALCIKVFIKIQGKSEIARISFLLSFTPGLGMSIRLKLDN